MVTDDNILTYLNKWQTKFYSNYSRTYRKHRCRLVSLLKQKWAPTLEFTKAFPKGTWRWGCAWTQFASKNVKKDIPQSSSDPGASLSGTLNPALASFGFSCETTLKNRISPFSLNLLLHLGDQGRTTRICWPLTLPSRWSIRTHNNSSTYPWNSKAAMPLSWTNWPLGMFCIFSSKSIYSL